MGTGQVQFSALCTQITRRRLSHSTLAQRDVNADHRALGGAEDVGEAETALVLVPGTKRRRRELALARAFEEPDDERCVEQADEGRDAQHRRLRSRGRVRESEQLLSFAEKDLNSPPARIGFQNAYDGSLRVCAEEDANWHGSLVCCDDDNAQKTYPARAVPLRAQRLVPDRSDAPIRAC